MPLYRTLQDADGEVRLEQITIPQYQQQEITSLFQRPQVAPPLWLIFGRPWLYMLKLLWQGRARRARSTFLSWLHWKKCKRHRKKIVFRRVLP